MNRHMTAERRRRGDRERELAVCRGSNLEWLTSEPELRSRQEPGRAKGHRLSSHGEGRRASRRTPAQAINGIETRHRRDPDREWPARAVSIVHRQTRRPDGSIRWNPRDNLLGASAQNRNWHSSQADLSIGRKPQTVDRDERSGGERAAGQRRRNAACVIAHAFLQNGGGLCRDRYRHQRPDPAKLQFFSILASSQDNHAFTV